jgi:hypothetical protein
MTCAGDDGSDVFTSPRVLVGGRQSPADAMEVLPPDDGSPVRFSVGQSRLYVVEPSRGSPDVWLRPEARSGATQ